MVSTDILKKVVFVQSRYEREIDKRQRKEKRERWKKEGKKGWRRKGVLDPSHIPYDLKRAVSFLPFLTVHVTLASQTLVHSRVRACSYCPVQSSIISPASLPFIPSDLLVHSSSLSGFFFPFDTLSFQPIIQDSSLISLSSPTP